MATWAVLGLGVALRVVAYLRRDVLWVDEAATARNILDRSLSRLLTVPLDYGQAAPKGFLLMEWVASRVLGASELALRFIPFVAGIASLLLFAGLARRLLTPPGAFAALLFFAVGYVFLVYSADVHPYGVDLALALGGLLLAIDLRRLGYPVRRVWWTAAYGALAVWCSTGAMVALFGIGSALGAIAWRERGARGALLALWPVAAMWGASAGAAAWVARQSLSPNELYYFRWALPDSMVPLLRSPAAARWLWDAWRGHLAPWHGWWSTNPAWTSLYVALALVGFVSLLRRRTGDAIVAGSVVASYVLVSMAKQYPYDVRFVVASVAIFVLGIGESVGVLATARWGRATFVPRVAAVLLCVPPLYRVVTYSPPYQWTVVGSYLAQIRARWQPGDVVYATYGSALEVLYNAPKFGLRPTDYVLGPCDLSDPRVSLRAVDAVRTHRRAWLIAGTGQYFPSSPEYGYLRTIGVRRDSLPVRIPGSIRSGAPEPFDIATAYLFDLSDSARLARATPDSYVFSPLIRPISRASSRWNCYGVWSPLVREN
jgi:hypothetical protein